MIRYICISLISFLKVNIVNIPRKLTNEVFKSFLGYQPSDTCGRKKSLISKNRTKVLVMTVEMTPSQRLVSIAYMIWSF